MQHISLNEGQDLVPLRCPSCRQLLCERVGKLQTERALHCRICQTTNSLALLVAGNPALGRVLSAQSDMKTMRRAI